MGEDNGEASRNVIPPVGTTNPPTDDSGDSSWVVIVSVILLSLFVVSFIIFLCRHWMQRRRGRSSSDTATTSLGRSSRSLVGSSTTGISYIHSTTRSTTHLPPNLRVDQAFVTSMAPQFNHGSQPKLMFYWENGIWKLCPNSVNNTQGHLNPFSAMREMDSSFKSEDVYMDVSKIEDFSTQTPCSQNSLTWVTQEAPPPSYEESEAGSPEKRLTMSVNTTNSEDTYSTCQTFDRDAFHVHNNTPDTDYEYSTSSMSCPQTQRPVVPGAEATINTHLTISHMTSYPSTLLSSTDASLTNSSLDTWEDDDTSFVTSYHDSSYSIPRGTGNNPSTAYTIKRGSQAESESSGVPSLPSSILNFHQKMVANSNAVFIERHPRRPCHPHSLVESDFMELKCPSMIPNGGDDSRNPCMSTPIPHSNARRLSEQGIQATFNRCDVSSLHGSHNRNQVITSDVNQFPTSTRVGLACWV